MDIKIKNSQDIGFLHKDKIDLNSIKDKLIKAKGIDENLYINITENIEQVIGNQEIQWISRNNPDNLVNYLIYRFKLKNYPQQKKLESFPLHLLVEPTSICNLQCVMCFQSDSSFKTKNYMGMIDLEFFKEIVDQAKEENCKALTLASRGEPLLHAKFDKMIRYCKNKFFELKINTNATRLTEDLCYEILDAGVDIVVFSVDSYYKEQYEKIRVGGDFDSVVENIKRFVEIRRSKAEYKKTSTRVAGCNFGNLNYSQKEYFFNYWKEIVDCVSFSDVVPRWNTYNNEQLNFNEPCNLLWDRMYVWHDGTCNPCDYDYKSSLQVGNAKKSSLKDIWLGGIYNKYRNLFLRGNRKLLFPCNRCNLF